MSSFTMGAPAERIAKLKGEILAHAVGAEVLGITGMQRQQPRNSICLMARPTPTSTRATAQRSLLRPMN